MGILLIFIVWALLYGAYILRHFLDTPFDWLIAGAIIGFIAWKMPDDWLKRIIAMAAWTRGPTSRLRKVWEWFNGGR